MSIQINQLEHQASSYSLSVKNWQILPEQHWVIFSTYSHCGALLGQILTGDITADVADISGLPETIGWVSLSQQQALLEIELENDDPVIKLHGSKVEALVLAACNDPTELDYLLELVDLTHLRYRGFRQLSTGETRRVMLARALATQPKLLILDEPFAGLDVAHQHQLSQLLKQLSTQLQLLLITAREDEVPECITHVAMFTSKQAKSGKEIHQLGDAITIEQWQNHPVISQLNALSLQQSEQVITLIKQHQQPVKFADPLIELKNTKVEYTDALIFKDVNWQIKRNQHWQLRGANGCGKSTLLGLILGDHPQCYCNDIQVFGQQRGSGESIWQVKEQIGIVSAALHLQYRVNCSARDVLLSGFFDSIGLYQKATQNQIDIAKNWLTLLHMEQFEKTGFKQLDYGQQRLLLIGRALIKQPILLILDEPYQGLDFINRKLVFNVLNMIAAENLSQLLYVSHHAEDALPAIKNYVDFVGDGTVKIIENP